MEVSTIDNCKSKLSEIIKEGLLAESRLSFIITDADGQARIARNLSDKAIERKIEAGIPFSDVEEKKFEVILNRMKQYQEPKPLHDFLIDGYFYHGEADADAINRLPFVVTDLEDNPQLWRIWDKLLTPETATPEQYERAKLFVDNSKAMGRYAILQTNPGPFQGYLYYEVNP